MVQMVQKKHEKTPIDYNCEYCDFNTSHKGLWNRHIITPKHKMVINGNEKTPKNTTGYKCVCGKEYKHKSALSRHNKECFIINNLQTANSDKNLIKELVVANQDLTNKIVEQGDKIVEQSDKIIELAKVPKTINNTNNITNNMTINMYLNEKCGNAMNIKNFVQNLTITLEQLMYTKEHGLAKGITNILVDNFKDVDQTERPIHCTDDKRHSLQIKDETWKTNKEEPNLIDEFVTSMSNRHFGALQEWAEDHPGWLKQNNKDEDFYLDCIAKIGNPSWSTEKNNKAFLVEISKCKEFKLDKKMFNK
jgi:hypothetical protein